MTRLGLAFALLASAPAALAQQPPPPTIPVPAPLLDRMVRFIEAQPYVQAAPLMREIEAFAQQQRQAPPPPPEPAKP